MNESSYFAHIAKDNNGNISAYQTCTEHARNVASLCAEMLSGMELRCSGYVSGLLHDCGKFTDEFNTYLHKAVTGEPIKKGSVIHSFAGVRYLIDNFHSYSSLTVEDLPSEILAAAVGSHHGLIDIWDQQQNNGFEYRLRKQPDYDAKAIEVFNECCADKAEVSDLYTKAQQEILNFYKAKIVPYAKGNQEGFFALGLLTRLITSAVTDADRTDTAMFMQGMTKTDIEPVSWKNCLNAIEDYLSGFQGITTIQNARSIFSNVCAQSADRSPGLYRLDLPTGGGKTLAALRFAVAHAKRNNMRRIFYIAPLLSIIEQNASVIRAAVNETLPVLEHHSNVICDNLSPEEVDRIELLHETWESPIIVTTLVQLLETMFSHKMSSVRRFHQLCESVIIIDEVQSLPPRMLTLFNCAVSFLTKCCGTTVVLCSATQPAFEKACHPVSNIQRLVPENVYEEYAPLFRRTEIIDAGICTMDDVYALAKSILNDADSLLIICNTKREAIELFSALKDWSQYRCFHLSAGMCTAHRKEMLALLTKALTDGTKLICVSTQVIEAGIDVSFGAVIRFSAGLDNIVQAAGRCNRHGEYEGVRPVHICRLGNEKLGSLREIRDAQNALNALLSEYRHAPEKYGHDLTSDKAVNDYYTFLYKGMTANGQDYPAHGYTLFDLLSENKQLASTGNFASFLNQAFRTAGEWFEVFDHASTSVVVPFHEGRMLIEELSDDKLIYDLTRANAILEQTKPFTVSVPISKAEQMIADGLAYTVLNGTVFVLNEGYYDDETGIKEGNDLCNTLIL